MERRNSILNETKVFKSHLLAYSKQEPAHQHQTITLQQYTCDVYLLTNIKCNICSRFCSHVHCLSCNRSSTAWGSHVLWNTFLCVAKPPLLVNIILRKN